MIDRAYSNFENIISTITFLVQVLLYIPLYRYRTSKDSQVMQSLRSVQFCNTFYLHNTFYQRIMIMLDIIYMYTNYRSQLQESKSKRSFVPISRIVVTKATCLSLLKKLQLDLIMQYVFQQKYRTVSMYACKTLTFTETACHGFRNLQTVQLYLYQNIYSVKKGAAPLK